MKKLLLSASIALCMASAHAQEFEDAATAVVNFKAGWNLGNTLDSNSGDVDNMWIERWTSRRPVDYETSWGQPSTTRELIHMFKEAGFGAIRVPVTWYPHMGTITLDANGHWDQATWTGYEVNDKWMARVHEVVDYVIDEGMYCILNVHHDTGDGTTAWLHASESSFDAAKERYESLWQQIATEFADYDQHLVFEAYNEMLDPIGSWCFASFATGYDAEIARSAYSAINQYAQSFVDVVRATGGNNGQRNLIVNTYGSCCGSGTWNSHLADPLKQMALPEDVVDGHIIFEIHSYPNTENLTNAKKDIDQVIDLAKDHLMTKGAPVILGEWGTSGKTDTNSQRSNYLQFARYCVRQAKEAGIGTFHWMGLIDGNDRKDLRWTDTQLRDEILKGWYGDDYDPAGVTAITCDDDPNAPVYNLQGIRVDNPTLPGIYIRAGKKFVVR